MRYAIPLLGDRVAPRCTFADSILLVTLRRGRITEQATVRMDGTTWADLARVLSDQRVDTMVCGGISRSTRDSIRANHVEIVENVAGRSEEILQAIQRGVLEPGYGLASAEYRKGTLPDDPDRSPRRLGRRRRAHPAGESAPVEPAINCLACTDRRCLRGESCPSLARFSIDKPSASDERILASAMDVAFEEERTLCRIAELVYFCLGMDYRRIGLAFCIDLLEPATVLAGVLQRFFEVFPVCCRVGGVLLDEPGDHVQAGYDPNITACNPLGQAAVLNSLHTDLNVMVGLCVGVDCVFSTESNAPTTTLFVKDKSLANNPIGAVYSHYYLQDI